MQITIGKILALLVALGFVVVTIDHAHGITVDVITELADLLPALMLIWFPDEFGSFLGYVGKGGNINIETPPFLISMAGWFFLVGFPVLTYFLASAR